MKRALEALAVLAIAAATLAATWPGLYSEVHTVAAGSNTFQVVLEDEIVPVSGSAREIGKTCTVLNQTATGASNSVGVIFTHVGGQTSDQVILKPAVDLVPPYAINPHDLDPSLPGITHIELDTDDCTDCGNEATVLTTCVPAQ